MERKDGDKDSDASWEEKVPDETKSLDKPILVRKVYIFYPEQRSF